MEPSLHLAHARDEHARLRLERRVAHDDQLVAAAHPVAGTRGDPLDEPLAAGPHDRLVRDPDDALGARPEGQRHVPDEPDGEGHERHAHRDGAPAHPPEPGARQQVGDGPDQGDPDPGDGRGGGDQHTQQQELGGDEEDDAGHDQHPVGEGGDGVADEPEPLPGRRRAGVGVLAAEEVALRQVAEVGVGARAEVRDLDEVGEDVVAVEPEERVRVEEERGGPRDEDHVVGERAHGARLDAEPQAKGERRDEQLDEHARGADQDPPPLAAERRGGGGVHVGHGREHQEHDAHVVDLAPPGLRHEGVAQLVERLDGGEREPQEEQALGGHHAVHHVAAEVAPVRGGEDGARAHDGEPDERPEPAHQRADEPQEALQEPLRVEQRHAPGEEGQELALPAPALLPLAPPEHLRGVRRDVGLEHVGPVELAQELDHLVLRGRLVAQAPHRRVPDLLHGPVPVHQADHQVRRRREAVEARGRAVLEDVPELPAVLMAVDLGVRPEAGGEARHAVPRGAEERATHRRALMAARTRGRGGPSRQPGGSRSRRATGGRSRPSRRPPSPGGAARGWCRGSPRRGSSCALRGPWTPG